MWINWCQGKKVSNFWFYVSSTIKMEKINKIDMELLGDICFVQEIPISHISLINKK